MGGGAGVGEGDCTWYEGYERVKEIIAPSS